jgi:hypothetical protein
MVVAAVTYTKEAALAIMALHNMAEGEKIDCGKALLTLCDLPPHESAFPQALRSAWNETFRDQYRDVVGGKPETEHLRYSMPVGAKIRLQDVLDEAQMLAAGDQSPIAQVHLAKALVTKLSGLLPSLAIDGHKLIAEIGRVEIGPQQERIRQVKVLEQARFVKVQEEVVRANVQRLQTTPPANWVRGNLVPLIEEVLRGLLQQRIKIRKEVMQSVPELNSMMQFDALGREIEEWLDARARPTLIDIGHAIGVAPDDQTPLNRRLEELLIQLKAEARRDIGILRNEAGLGLRDPAQGTNVTIQGSNVGVINVGTVMGDIRATATSLENRGSTDLATRLREFSEAIENSQDLGERRFQILEAIAEIGEQVLGSTKRRRPSVVATLGAGVTALLEAAPPLLSLWRELEAVIQAQLGSRG